MPISFSGLVRRGLCLWDSQNVENTSYFLEVLPAPHQATTRFTKSLHLSSVTLPAFVQILHSGQPSVFV